MICIGLGHRWICGQVAEHMEIILKNAHDIYETASADDTLSASSTQYFDVVCMG
jgi:hypothetical protein